MRRYKKIRIPSLPDDLKDQAIGQINIATIWVALSTSEKMLTDKPWSSGWEGGDGCDAASLQSWLKSVCVSQGNWGTTTRARRRRIGGACNVMKCHGMPDGDEDNAPPTTQPTKRWGRRRISLLDPQIHSRMKGNERTNRSDGRMSKAENKIITEKQLKSFCTCR